MMTAWTPSDRIWAINATGSRWPPARAFGSRLPRVRPRCIASSEGTRERRRAREIPGPATALSVVVLL